MIDRRVAENVLEAALATGGDYSELFMEDTEANTISMMDGKVETAQYTRLSGAGVRVLLGGRSVYAYSADTSEGALMAAAEAAAAALAGPKTHSARGFTLTRTCSNPIELPYDSIANARRVALLAEATRAAKAVSSEITQVVARTLDVDQRVLIATSDGVWATDRRPRGKFILNAVATGNEEAQMGSLGPGAGRGFEFFNGIDPGAIGKKAAETALTMLHAPQCPAGFVPVVIDGGFGGVILHEACVHSLEATSVARNNSEFSGKLGQRIASDLVTAIDDGTLEGEWGSVNVDDEGMPAQRNVLIENGILKSYLVDLVGSRLMDHPRTGSGRRESYAYAPTSRMTNTFFAPGRDDPEEMIRTMGDGLFAAQMGGGSVNPLTGEFNFAVLEGYWVKDGRIHSPVRGATLVGRGADVLMHIDRVAERMWFGQGVCGSLSGSVPTSVGQPRIRVSGITVGGKGGAL